MDLPELFPFHGDWDTYLDQLYEIYLREIVHGGITFRGLPVKSQYRPPTEGKGYGFWHVISEGPREADRLPDLRRCERIRWIRWVIQLADVSDDLIKCWENKRGGSTHVVLWLESHDFVVILARRRKYYLLKTAYNVTKPHRKKSFQREYEKYWGNKKG